MKPTRRANRSLKKDEKDKQDVNEESLKTRQQVQGNNPMGYKTKRPATSPPIQPGGFLSNKYTKQSSQGRAWPPASKTVKEKQR